MLEFIVFYVSWLQKIYSLNYTLLLFDNISIWYTVALLQGVVQGFTGVVTKPVEGAKQEGVGGFFKGKISNIQIYPALEHTQALSPFLKPLACLHQMNIGF